MSVEGHRPVARGASGAREGPLDWSDLRPEGRGLLCALLTADPRAGATARWATARWRRALARCWMGSLAAVLAGASTPRGSADSCSPLSRRRRPLLLSLPTVLLSPAAGSVLECAGEHAAGLYGSVCTED
jgi:hypothetical protein